VLRAVADTNAVVSGLLWQGSLRPLLAAARARRIALYTSAVLLEELAEVLTRVKFGARIASSNYDARELVYRYTRLARLVVPAEIGPVSRKLSEECVRRGNVHERLADAGSLAHARGLDQLNQPVAAELRAETQ